MKLFARKKRLPRELSLQAKPAKSPVSHALPRKDGGLNVTVELERPRWQVLLGADATAERTFGLDPYGKCVYELCNAKRSVKQIIKDFGRKQSLSRAEAELSVTAFLKTLMSKGLIVMEFSASQGG